MKKLLMVMLSVLLLTSCSTPIARVGNIEISKNEFEFYLKSIKEQMSDTEFQTEEDWQNKEIEGRKAIEVAKEQAMDNAAKNALYIATAKAAGISLTDADKQEVKGIKGEFMSVKGSDAGYKKFLKENNIDDKFIELMCESSVYYRKIGEVVAEDTTITEEMKKSHFEENKTIIETGVRKAKHILIATIDPETMQPKSQEEQETASVLAKGIFDRIQSGENFDKLMNEYSEDPGLSTSPDGYVFRSGEMVAEFEEAVDSVGFNQLAFCKSEFGYHIIKRLPVTYEDAKEEVEYDLLRSLIEKRVEQWQKEYSISVTRDEKMYSEIK